MHAVLVGVHLGPVRRVTKLGTKWAELVQLRQKFVPRSRFVVFSNECSHLVHWTLNSCFRTLRTIWVHLGPFHRLTKLGSKWAELVRLMQKFVLRNRVRIFGNERS